MSTRKRQKGSRRGFRNRFRNFPEEKVCVEEGRIGGLRSLPRKSYLLPSDVMAKQFECRHNLEARNNFSEGTESGFLKIVGGKPAGKVFCLAHSRPVKGTGQGTFFWSTFESRRTQTTCNRFHFRREGASSYHRVLKLLRQVLLQLPPPGYKYHLFANCTFVPNIFRSL